MRRLWGPKFPLPIPAAGRVCYAIGDIHGCRRQLDHLHDLIAADAARIAGPAIPTLVYLGDYIDRGPDSKGVIECLASSPPDGFERRFMRGNHDGLPLEFIRDPGTLGRWRAVGGLETLASYGMPPPPPNASERELAGYRDTFASRFPATHRTFLEALEPSWMCGSILFTHAGVRPGLPVNRQTPEDLMWIREPFLSSLANFGAFVVHGHSSAYRIERRHNRMGVDTGAYATGRLSCAVFDGTDPRIIVASR